jgi:hypothetical protein
MISVWVQFLLGLQVGNGTFDAQILEIGLVHGHGNGNQCSWLIMDEWMQ